MRYMTNNGSCHACRHAEPRVRAEGCGCGTIQPRTQAAVECADLPVMAYVPVQVWDCVYTCGQALERGTLFPALDKPFMGKGGCCNG